LSTTFLGTRTLPKR